LQTGELNELDNNYLSAGYSTNDQEEKVFIKYDEFKQKERRNKANQHKTERGERIED